MRLNRAVAALAISSLWAASAPCGEGWGPYGAWKARRTVAIPAAAPVASPGHPKQPEMRDVDCVYVAFPTGEFLRPDGGDLRVTIEGRPAPFKVVDIGYGGVVRLVAGIPGPATQMQVYYGNPEAKALSSDWEPHRGLWLETRHYAGGECKTLEGIRQAIAKSDARYGAEPVAQIFHGFNPFGPSDNYLSLYKGWLCLDKDATVTFAAIADDIGYVLVGDTVVAAKQDWGDMPGNRRFAGEPMLLRKGLHPIAMLHVEATGNQAAGAAWWMAGMPRGEKYLHFQVIPPNAFAPLRYGTLTNYEVQGQAASTDFSAANEGDVVLDSGPMLIRFVFKDMSRPAPRALQCQPLWEFGDGTSSASRDPSHVYLRPGDYTVTLTLESKAAKYQARQKIRIGPGYERAARRQWDGLADYLPILEEYQFEKMATADLLVASQAFEDLQDAAGTVATGRLLFLRIAGNPPSDELDETAFVHQCILLGRTLRDFKPKPPEEKPGVKPEEEPPEKARERAEEALRVFTRAELRTKDVHAKARLANEKGDIYYYYLNDLEKAEKEYTKTLTEYAKAADAQVRVAQMRIGDLYRTKGDYQAALRGYERAAEMPIHTHNDAVEAAHRGSFPRTVEDYTARKLYKEAHEALDEWDWEFPADKLVGYSSLLRARLAKAEGNLKEAQKQADELVRANKASEYADDLLLFLVDLHIGTGELDKALETAARLLTDYPASDLQEEAHLRRIRIHLQQAKYEDAAKEALELASVSPDSSNAPKALLLAATAQSRAKQKDEAIKTLERLAQKYPTTEEATAGLKMLKELRPR